MNDSFPVAVVTGGSRGLGLAIAKAFRAASHRVVCLSRTTPETVDDGMVWIETDVTNSVRVSAAVEEISRRFGRIDVWINNAGIARDHLLLQMDDDAFSSVLDVNLRGAFFCCRAISRLMARQRGGHIVNIASFSGRAGAVGQSNYAASKAGLVGLTQSLAKELGSRDVKVNAVLPGVLPTAMTSNLSPDQMGAFEAANCLRRINDLEEVANFVVFLSRLRNVSGQIFQLDSRIAPWT